VKAPRKGEREKWLRLAGPPTCAASTASSGTPGRPQKQNRVLEVGKTQDMASKIWQTLGDALRVTNLHPLSSMQQIQILDRYSEKILLECFLEIPYFSHPLV